jgi:hypothetical protein
LTSNAASVIFCIHPHSLPHGPYFRFSCAVGDGETAFLFLVYLGSKNHPTPLGGWRRTHPGVGSTTGLLLRIQLGLGCERGRDRLSREWKTGSRNFDFLKRARTGVRRLPAGIWRSVHAGHIPGPLRTCSNSTARSNPSEVTRARMRFRNGG